MSPRRIEDRITTIGHEIFELSEAARPRPWQLEWWQECMMHAMDHDDALRTRAFQFVDCLPSLTSDAELARHLVEYFCTDRSGLSRAIAALLGDAPLQSTRHALIGRAARMGAVQMAGKFITGYDIPSALRTIKKLRAGGMAFTLDVLGESTTSDTQAQQYADAYGELCRKLTDVAGEWTNRPTIDQDERGPMPRVNFSIKLTGLDPHFDPIDPVRSIHNVGARLRPLLREAKERGAFVNVDMESTKHRALTFTLFKQLLMEDEFRDWVDVGIVVQAYLRDSEHDLAELLSWGKQRGCRFAIRLVKGAYWDAESAAAVRHYKTSPAWSRKWESDACYERMARTMLEHIALIRPAFASHNVRSLSCVLALAQQMNLSPRQYELQTLFGMGDPLKHALVALGQCVRVYCPYGDLMPGMGYLIRRLLENTSNEGFLKQASGDPSARDRLLMDPNHSRPPSAHHPTRHYVNTDPEEPMPDFKNASNTNFALADSREKMSGALTFVRGEFGRACSHIIDGAAVSGDAWFESTNPSQSSQVVGRIAVGTAALVDRAVTAARCAFSTWRLSSAADRAALSKIVANRLEMRRFELAATIILETGKPWREADADVTEAIDHWRYYADQIERIESRPRLRNLPGEDNLLTYSPKGVCGVISTWAFPLAILSGMTSAALAAGNTVVVKPARQAAVVASKLVEILLEVGFPGGVVNLVHGGGDVVGQRLCVHPDVDIVAFTGSCAAGSEVIRAGSNIAPGQTSVRKMIVEMGGNNAIIIDDDADLDGAVQAVIESAFACAGQKCSSCRRLIVVDGVYDAMMGRLRDAVLSIPIGPAADPSTVVGPLIDEKAHRRIEELMELGRREYHLLVEANLPDGLEGGYYVPPVIFTDVGADSRFVREEVFGPILVVLRAVDFDEALKLANATPFALTGGLFSRSPAHIDRARREFDVGNLYINRRITGSQVDAQPFGGFGLSGTGVKAGSPDYLLHFMDARCITENTTRSGFVPDQQHTEVV